MVKAPDDNNATINDAEPIVSNSMNRILLLTIHIIFKNIMSLKNRTVRTIHYEVG